MNTAHLFLFVFGESGTPNTRACMSAKLGGVNPRTLELDYHVFFVPRGQAPVIPDDARELVSERINDVMDAAGFEAIERGTIP